MLALTQLNLHAEVVYGCPYSQYACPIGVEVLVPLVVEAKR